MPANATGKVPAMIIAHGSDGVSPKLFERRARLFNGDNPTQGLRAVEDVRRF